MGNMESIGGKNIMTLISKIGHLRKYFLNNCKLKEERKDIFHTI